MMNIRKTYFISDLHLEENRPDITQQFLNLLGERDSDLDALYILGDLFEVWIGDDACTAFQEKIIQSLKKATASGLPIYFIHGNRDFLIGKQFLKDTGCILLSDPEKISLYGKHVLLMHGDTLCTRDIAYLKARRLGHNTFLQWLFLKMPLSLRKRFADKMRKKSMNHTRTVNASIMDVTQSEVERVMREHDVSYLIHGHTHRPGQHHFPLCGHQATRMVLGAWHDGASILIWNQYGEVTIHNDSGL